MIPADQYYKVASRRIEYLGQRFFRFNPASDSVVQVCLSCGDVKKGKSNTFGVYLIHKMTFFSNYLSPNYIEPCSKKEYEKHFKKVFQMLK